MRWFINWMKPGDDRKRTVDVMDDTGVNLAAGAGDFLVRALAVQFLLQLLQLLGVAADFVAEERRSMALATALRIAGMSKGLFR